MAESGRKRCRKSKLVPRDCADFVEDDAVLQDIKEPPKKLLLLEKIKKEPVDYVPVPQASAHEFSVNVEVEDMEGPIPEDDPSNYMKYLFSLSTGSQEPKDMEFVDNDSLIEKRPVLEDEKSCAIDTKKLIRMLALLPKKYPDEKEVVIHTRNQWGRVFVEGVRVSEPSSMTTQEIQLQDVLRQWRNWTVSTNSRMRESPFSYKCYVCENAWWTFTEFSGHLTLHPECKLQLEILQQECNIVAYEGNAPVIKDIPVHGRCIKCAKSYDHHMSYRIETDAYYYCNYCQDRFQTCSALAKHEGTCLKSPIRALSIFEGKHLKFSEFPCEVCRTVFLSTTDLSEHLTICHKVRSDEPIFTQQKTCQFCKQAYFNFNFHSCFKKHGNHDCQYCHRKFQNKHLLKYHLKAWNGVVRCRICYKFIRRSCMAAEHYALHSDNFEVVHRCLVCKKVKVFVSEEAVRIHRSKYHTHIDARRPRTEKIIMSKLMLQQCFIGITRKIVPKIRQKAASCPKNLECPKSDRFKLTRGETMQQVRVYAPVKRKEPPARRRTDNSNKESQIANTTFAHDNIVTMRSKAPENDKIQVKKENDDTVKDETINGNEHDKDEPRNDKENYTVPESVFDNTNIVVKTEKMDYSIENISEQSNAVGNDKVTKDNTELMAELNEFLDIKPDIVRIKEEKVSDDETELSSLFQISDTSNVTHDISKVFRASSAFAEEVTEESEHSNVFRVSQALLDSDTVIKKEIKEEPDDSSVLNSSNDSKKDVSDSDGSLLNLEPEVILKAGYRKRKVYRCKKCDFSAYHREYREHINSHCQTSKIRQEVIEADVSYKCTKCNVTFPSIKRYVLHFEKYHLYQFMSCPQCRVSFDSVTKLVPHVNAHIKNQFVRLLVLGHEETSNAKAFQCKTCKEVEDTRGSFEHWEKHLELSKELPVPVEEPFRVGPRGEHALKAEVLKDVLAALVREVKPNGPDSRLTTKTCVVCARRFERKHDVKRHLVEHLLEDAYANIVDDMMLKCQICFKLHKKPEYYKKHMRDHASLPIYQCTICDKSFSDSSNFTKHKKIHNLKAFVCDICSKKFQAKFSLERHIEMHMKMAPITCERCDKVFYWESFYRRHVRQHHDKPVNRFKCNLCRESYSTLKEKWDHLWIVHKQRKEKADCPVCGKSYRKFSDVKKHVQHEHGMEVRWLTAGMLANGKGKVSTLTDGRKVVEGIEVKMEDDSDDDCLLIEEERETLVVYD